MEKLAIGHESATLEKQTPEDHMKEKMMTPTSEMRLHLLQKQNDLEVDISSRPKSHRGGSTQERQDISAKN